MSFFQAYVLLITFLAGFICGGLSFRKQLKRFVAYVEDSDADK
jgi:hypothetical protein